MQQMVLTILIATMAMASSALANPCYSNWFEPPSNQRWLEARSRQYSIFYIDRYREDVPFVRRVFNNTERLMRNKYGVSRHGYDVAVYLEPRPTGWAGVGRAVILTWGSSQERQACIYYLTPSAPDWEEAGRRGATTNVGLPFDNDRHAATLTHEYVTIAQSVVKDTKPRGFRGKEPNWWTQGLQTYDGEMHSTRSNRRRFLPALIAKADTDLRAKINCCRTLDNRAMLSTSDDYRGGMLILWFLADTCGESAHYDVLNSEKPTWEAAFTTVLRDCGYTIPTAFTEMRRWFNRQVAAVAGNR